MQKQQIDKTEYVSLYASLRDMGLLEDVRKALKCNRTTLWRRLNKNKKVDTQTVRTAKEILQRAASAVAA